MLFRFYLPLYSLLKQSGELEPIQSEIKKLLLDEKAAAFTRKLMREVPMVDTKGNSNGGTSYS
jgi:hypothetical protein